ncbi:transmembrane protein 26-like [Diadema antillarum]|uniref:transmembrane protein 26-like n=1 Tax=Diadema antillarum TaxID=105358 RepID=UPI003A84567B
MGVISLVKALIARLFFGVHGVIVIWRVTTIYDSYYFYALLAPLVLLIAEMGVTLKCTDTGEWKWMCPSVLLYLLSVVPCMWLLQLDLYSDRIEYRDENDLDSCVAETSYNESTLEAVQGVTIPVSLSSDKWVLVFELTILFLLILGRWLLPKGALTRDQLSQLLLVYVGMAADILEFSLESLKEPTVFCDLTLIVIVLIIWSWSLTQFTLVLTSVAGKRRRVVLQDGSRSCSEECCSCCMCCQNEMWSMIITLLMQDIPFLAMRLYLMIQFNVFNIMMVFFTCKNVLVILLQGYRMMILCGNNEVAPEDDTDEEAKADDARNSPPGAPDKAMVVVESK